MTIPKLQKNIPLVSLGNSQAQRHGCSCLRGHQPIPVFVGTNLEQICIIVYAYRVCIPDMHIGEAYQMCISDMHIRYAYLACTSDVHTRYAYLTCISDVHIRYAHTHTICKSDIHIGESFSICIPDIHTHHAYSIFAYRICLSDLRIGYAYAVRGWPSPSPFQRWPSLADPAQSATARITLPCQAWPAPQLRRARPKYDLSL